MKLGIIRSEALSSMYSKTRELSSLILKMVVEGFDLPQHYNLDVEELGSTNDTRLTRYQHPEEKKDTEIAFVPHTDMGTITFICENEVQGLQVLSKTGNWVDVNIPPNGFVVICGDALKVILSISVISFTIILIFIKFIKKIVKVFIN